MEKEAPLHTSQAAQRSKEKEVRMLCLHIFRDGCIYPSPMSASKTFSFLDSSKGFQILKGPAEAPISLAEQRFSASLELKSQKALLDYQAPIIEQDDNPINHTHTHTLPTYAYIRTHSLTIENPA